MSLRVYLAAPYAARAKVNEYAKELREIGMTVTSSWLEEKHEIGSGTVGAATDLGEPEAKAHVAKDFRDIDRSDVLVLFTASAIMAHIVGGSATSGGRHVETGYAIAKGVHVIVVGTEENIFHRTLDYAADWHRAVLALVAFERTMPKVAAP